MDKLAFLQVGVFSDLDTPSLFLIRYHENKPAADIGCIFRTKKQGNAETPFSLAKTDEG